MTKPTGRLRRLWNESGDPPESFTTQFFEADASKRTLVVLLPGAESGSSWAEVIRLVNDAGFDVLRIANPFGSDDPATLDSYTCERAFEDVLDAILPRAGGRPVLLVGHSYGCVDAARLAADDRLKAKAEGPIKQVHISPPWIVKELGLFLYGVVMVFLAWTRLLPYIVKWKWFEALVRRVVGWWIERNFPFGPIPLRWYSDRVLYAEERAPHLKESERRLTADIVLCESWPHEVLVEMLWGVALGLVALRKEHNTKVEMLWGYHDVLSMRIIRPLRWLLGSRYAGDNGYDCGHFVNVVHARAVVSRIKLCD